MPPGDANNGGHVDQIRRSAPRCLLPGEEEEEPGAVLAAGENAARLGLSGRAWPNSTLSFACRLPWLPKEKAAAMEGPEMRVGTTLALGGAAKAQAPPPGGRSSARVSRPSPSEAERDILAMELVVGLM